ncbi:VanZ family protein [candidate division KSB1 bacterium]|nr:VanZ family protein [candidate division KSB1 bacterium]
MRRLTGYLVLFLTFLVIFTLSPLVFSVEHFREFLQIEMVKRIQDLFVFKSYDVFGNVLLFIPFGLWLRSVFTQKNPNRSVSFWLPVIIGLSLSLMVELAQLFLIRSTSVVDLISNTSGTVLGFHFSNQIFRLIHWIRSCMPRFLRIIVTLTMALVIILIFLLPVHYSNFSKWNPDYPLVFYNEASGDRPWDGEINDCIFLNHALDVVQIQRIYNSDSWELEDSLPATFGIALTVPPNTGERPPHTGSLGQIIAPPMMETSQMTLLLSLRTERLDQSGPARIVTQSMDPTRRNWTLGQMGTSLVFRVRTPISGRNGSKFQLIAFNCLPDTEWHHVVATYNRGVSKIYIDGAIVPSNMNLSRDYLPVMFGMGRHAFAWLAFCFVLFIPFFFLLYVQIRRIRTPIAMGGLILVAFGIELVIFFLTSQPVSGVVPLSAFIIGLIGVGFIGLLRNPK